MPRRTANETLTDKKRKMVVEEMIAENLLKSFPPARGRRGHGRNCGSFSGGRPWRNAGASRIPTPRRTITVLGSWPSARSRDTSGGTPKGTKDSAGG